ncbi:hypothetical protein GOV04_03305 [Candidatus Woesearchaeota archaeon]|nr:hypothetical protein [Candidatus Woesearchaeota archaeon]
MKNIKSQQFLIILLVISTLFSTLLIIATSGNYSITSPFGCGSICNGGYELEGHTELYCQNNPQDCYRTIDDCKDGNNPSYEYIEDINITNLDNNSFRGGDNVEVTVVFDCDEEGDTIAINYHNGTAWTNKYLASCVVSAKQPRTVNFTLDDVKDNHSVRGAIAYGSHVSLLCSATGDNTYSDSDDITFFVNSSIEFNPPSVNQIISPTIANTYELIVPQYVQLIVDVSDDTQVDSVRAQVDWPGGTKTQDLILEVGGSYERQFINTSTVGRYNITILANDTNSNTNNTEKTYFLIVDNSNITIDNPVHQTVYPTSEQIIQFSIQNNTVIESVSYEHNYQNYSLSNGVEYGNINESLASNSFNNTDLNLSQSFNLSSTIFARQVVLRLKKSGSGVSGAQVQLRTDNSGQPSNVVLANASINPLMISNNSFSWYAYTLNETLLLQEDTVYWIVLLPAAGSTDYFEWQASNNTYSRGDFLQNNSYDLLFKIYDYYNYQTSITLLPSTNLFRAYANITSSIIRSALLTVYLDGDDPQISQVSYVPTIAQDIDPGRAINVTAKITDNSIVANALLQYKQSNESTWNNASMSNISSIYNASFIPTNTGVWHFRVFAIDPSNYTANSTVQPLNVYYEYNWSVTSTDLGSKSAFLNTNKTIDNITITSNADIPLTFSLNKTASSVPTVYYNNSEYYQFVIYAHKNVSVQVKTTGLSSESTNKVSNLLKALNASANPQQEQINFTLVSYVSGPYLYSEIISYDPTVTQSDTRISLQASITNVGNETSYNNTIIWVLPVGWSARDNLTKNVSSLVADGGSTTHNIVVDISSTAPTGATTIRLISNNSAGIDSTQSKAVTVNALIVSPPPSGGSSSSQASGGFASKSYNLNITIPFWVEVVRGTITSFEVTLFNPEPTTELKNITFKIEGLLPVYYNFSISGVELLGYRNSTSFFTTIKTPYFLGEGNYPLNFTVEAIGSGKLRSFVEPFNLLVVSEGVANHTQCLFLTKEKIGILQSIGVDPTITLEQIDTLTSLLSNKNYLLFEQECDELVQILDTALTIEESIENIKTNMQRQGSNSQALNNALDLVRQAYVEGNLQLAVKRINDVELMIESQERNYKRSPAYFFGLLENYWWQAILALIASVLVVFTVYAKTSLAYVNKQLNSLQTKKERIHDLIGRSQKKHFKDRVISGRFYEQIMQKHREQLGLLELSRQKLILKAARLKGQNKKHALLEQQKTLQNHKKYLQEKYYVQKLLDRKTFMQLIKEHNNMKARIEQELGLLKKK